MFEKIEKIISNSLIAKIALIGISLYGLGYGVGKFIFYFFGK